MRVSLLILALFLLVAPPPGDAGAESKIPEEAPVRLTWDMLAQVSYSREARSFLPVFGSEIRDLEGRRVVVRGFMMARDHDSTDDRFVLSAYPMGRCFLCAPGGVTAVIEVVPHKALRFQDQPLFLEGTLELVPEDPLGILYRVTDAIPAPDGTPR